MSNVSLLVGGKLHTGWKSLEAQCSIEQMAGAFMLELSHHWPGAELPQGLREGLPCQLLLGTDPIITGYIDEYEPELDDKSCAVRVQGRDKTADLVDCAALYKGGQWRNAKLDQIVRDIVKPFGLAVVVQPGLDLGAAFKSFALEDGEKAFDAIDRACRMRAVLCSSTPTGAVWLGKSGVITTGVTLQEGVNIKRIRATHSWKDRHSKIIIKGQVPGDDDTYGAAAAHLQADAADAEINRYRPLIIQAEQGDASASLKSRAAWEVSVRMGRGKRGSVTVAGWRTGSDGLTGDVWRPNSLVRVISPRMQLDMDVLIVSCRFTLNDQGTLTELTFVRPEAFEQISDADAKARGRLKGKLRGSKHRGDGFVPSWETKAPTGGAQ